jgi:hypothetical protein
VAIGVIIATLPWIYYFGSQHAIKDWLTVYLYDNLFVYTQTPDTSANIPVIPGLFFGLLTTFKTNLITAIILLLGSILLYHLDKTELSRITLTTTITTFILIYIGGHCFQYYSLILTPFLAPYLGIIYQTCANRVKTATTPRTKHIITSGICILCLCGSILTPNLYFMRQSKDNLAQYQFKAIMQQDRNDITLLNYDFLDGGFYTVTNTVPTCKAFCGLNMPLDELTTLQAYYVENGLCDYVITKSRLHQDDGADFALYECIAECDSDDPAYGIDTYRLYRLKQ